MTSVGHSAVDRSWRRVDGIDVLRGLAIFFVLMNHVNIRLFLAKVPYTVGIPKQLVSSLVWNGQFGVQMFFAVSGFLITTTSLRRWGSLANISTLDFYRMRFARIAPLLLLLLIVLSAFHFADISGFVVAAKTGGLGRALLAALTFHVNLLEARRGYLPGPWDILWSLSVEEMFYLFFPLACLLFARRRLLVPLLCVFVFLGPFARTVFTHGNDIWQEKSYLGGMDAIALGCLTALLSSRIRFSQKSLKIIGGVGTAILVFMLCFSRARLRVGVGNCRTGDDGARHRNVPGHRSGIAVAMEGSAHTQSATRSGPAQLRGLSHAHVRCAGAVRNFREAGQADAGRAGAICLDHHSGCDPRRCGCASLF